MFKAKSAAKGSSLLAIASLLVCSLSSPVLCQDSPDIEAHHDEVARIRRVHEAEIEALKQQNALLNARVELEKSRQSLLETQFPQGASTGSAGTASVQGNFTVIQDMQVVRACQSIAGQIINKLGDEKTEFVVTSDLDFLKKLTMAEVMIEQAQTLTERLQEDSDNESLGAGITVAKSILSNAADISKFFQSTTTLIPSNSTITPTVLAAALCSKASPARTAYNIDIGYLPPIKETGALTAVSQLNSAYEESLKLSEERDETIKKQKAVLKEFKDALASVRRLRSVERRSTDQDKELAKASAAEDAAKKELKTAFLATDFQSETDSQKLVSLADKSIAINVATSKTKRETEAIAKAFLALLNAFEGTDPTTLAHRLQVVLSVKKWASTCTKGGDGSPAKKRALILFKLDSVGGSTRLTQNVFNSGSYSFSGGAVATYYIFAYEAVTTDNPTPSLVSVGTLDSHVGWQRLNDGGGVLKTSNGEEI